MIVTITSKCSSSADYIYDLLVNPMSGTGVLRGEKTCVQEHESLPDVMEFDLTPEEIEQLQKLPQINSITRDSNNVNFANYKKVNGSGIPRLANFTSTFPNNRSITSTVNHALYYCQTYELDYTHKDITSYEIMPLSSVDCSNVDILIMDSGVDATHPDLRDSAGNPLVVAFNWGLLREGDPEIGNVIIGNWQSLSANYNRDTDGHGTSCASLAAGIRNGFAKNAKIYNLRSNALGGNGQGFNNLDCMKLALAFQRAKNLNLHGLDSTRPTIWSNSWVFTGPTIPLDLETNNNALNLGYSIGNGKVDVSRPQNFSVIPYVNSVADSIFRNAISEGIHTLISAGNNNMALTNSPTAKFFEAHSFTKNDNWFTIPRTIENDNIYIINDVYNGYTYGNFGFTKERVYIYSSPNIGINVLSQVYNKENFPIISVGDITPVGFNDLDSNIYWTAGNAKSAFTILSSFNNNGSIIINNSTRYAVASGPFFIKSAYSNFGGDVDIYAPGNGSWSALSNQAFAGSIPSYTIASDNKYRFFNGTSAACPIVAGILATFLASNTGVTPLSAKNWLLNNSVSGNIMETQSNFLQVSSYNVINYQTPMEFGSNRQNVSTDPSFRLQKSTIQTYRSANIHDLLFCNRFFDSKNLIAQAYPLRKAVIKDNENQILIEGSVLTIAGSTDKKPTHQKIQVVA
jgi:hypothetical protein